MKRIIYYLLGIVLIVLSACQADSTPDSSVSHHPEVPSWAKEAIWYQIFVERFRNGDPSNDPTPEDMKGAFVESPPANWSITPWSHDWYERDIWFDSLERKDDFNYCVQLRRYGGDLQGVMDKLDYLQELGINAIYFNPLNDAPSLHKFDARHYRHIDRNFGPNPRGDVKTMAAEDPGDPASWQWTQADQLFLTLIQACHERGIRIVMDYSWNHTGQTFWALDDVRKNGENSVFKDWYVITAYDDPTTEENEFDYEGWIGIKSLPVLREDVIGPDHEPGKALHAIEGNLHSESLKQHIFAVSQRWLDPNGDGDPSDGVDGFRLDVAAEMTLGFWREYRNHVKSINPEAYLVGEIWWEMWPDDLIDPSPFLQGDVFDAVMNYRWYRLARRFFGQVGKKIGPEQFVKDLQALEVGFPTDNTMVMMNVSASHDSPRLATSLSNSSNYKYHSHPGDNPDYWIAKPTARTKTIQKLLLLHQFTYHGAPQIWNGDEVGMWGADDPSCRKPVVWGDLEYEDELAHVLPDKQRPQDKVEVDEDLLGYYQKLTSMRKRLPALRLGETNFLLADDAGMTLAYQRNLDDQEVIVVFNRSEEVQEVVIPISGRGVYQEIFSGAEMEVEDGKLRLELAPLSGEVWVRE